MLADPHEETLKLVATQPFDKLRVTRGTYFTLMAAPMGSPSRSIEFVGTPPAGYAQRFSLLGLPWQRS